MTIAIVDYGMGNLRSVYNALDILGHEADLVNDPSKLQNYDHVILPGVGSFRVCMENLRKIGFDQAVIEYVQSGNPLMGVCLGMQILASKGYEDGVTAGLNLIPGEIKKFSTEDLSIKIPHVGWNDVEFKWTDNPVGKGIKKKDTFYFTHSFYFECSDKSHIIAETNHGVNFTSAVFRDNIFATQFHPEKSQEMGLRLFKNFISWKP